LILKKILKTVATRWQIFRLKYTKFVVGWGSAADPAGGAYRGMGGEGRGGRERKGEGKGGEGRDPPGKILATGVMLDKFNRLNPQPNNIPELKTALLVIWDEMHAAGSYQSSARLHQRKRRTL